MFRAGNSRPSKLRPFVKALGARGRREKKRVSQLLKRRRAASLAHSIEAAYAALCFSEPLADVVWRRVVNEAELRANACGLTTRSQARTGYQFSNGPARVFGGIPPMSQLDQDAISFCRYTTEEQSNIAFIAETLTVSKAYLLYHTATYARWEAFALQLRSMLTESLGVALEAAHIANVRLEYRDVFKQPFEGFPPLASDLLRRDSDLLAPHIHNRREMFHSHTEFFFERCDFCDQRLIQVIVDANDHDEGSEQVRTISIITAVQDNFFQKREIETSRTPLDLISNFDTMRKRSADVFVSVVSDDIEFY
jgi:hypothetical protein